MEIKFDREEVEAMLIKSVNDMGMKVNTVSIDCYSYVRSATFSYVEPEPQQTEPVVAPLEAVPA